LFLFPEEYKAAKIVLKGEHALNDIRKIFMVYYLEDL